MTKIKILGFLKNVRSKISIRKLGFLVLVLTVCGNIVATVYLLQKKSVVVTQAPAVPAKEKELTSKELLRLKNEEVRQELLKTLSFLLPASSKLNSYFLSSLTEFVNDKYLKENTIENSTGIVLSFPEEYIFSLTIPHPFISSNRSLGVDLFDGSEKDILDPGLSYVFNDSSGFSPRIGARHYAKGNSVFEFKDITCEEVDISIKQMTFALIDLLELKRPIEQPCQYVEVIETKETRGPFLAMPTLSTVDEIQDSDVYAYHFNWDVFERNGYSPFKDVLRYKDYVILRKKTDDPEAPLAILSVDILSNYRDGPPFSSEQVSFFDKFVSVVSTSLVVIDECGYGVCY